MIEKKRNNNNEKKNKKLKIYSKKFKEGGKFPSKRNGDRDM